MTSADQVLNLTRGHIERTTTALWRTAERMVEEMHQFEDANRVALGDAFAAMKEAQAAYWEATQQVHSKLVAMVQAPLLGSNSDTVPSTH